MSTAYVAGTRRGAGPEALLADTPFSTDVDWRAEVAAARRAARDADAEQPQPPMLGPVRQGARAELGRGRHRRAGRQEPSSSARTGSRTGWSTLGRARAQALGWPDAYAYTKALGERALLERRGDVPVTIVRPVHHRVGPGRARARAGSGASAWPSR